MAEVGPYKTKIRLGSNGTRVSSKNTGKAPIYYQHSNSKGVSIVNCTGENAADGGSRTADKPHELSPGSASFNGNNDTSSTGQHEVETLLNPPGISPRRYAAVGTPISITIPAPLPRNQHNIPKAEHGITNSVGHHATRGTTEVITQRSAQSTTHLTASARDEIVAPSVKHSTSRNADQQDQCPVCIEPVKEPMKLSCGHTLCDGCKATWFSIKPVCPVCGRAHGEIRGNQPEGEMRDRQIRDRLPGFEDSSDGTIIVDYIFPPGTQKDSHPNPGRPYNSIRRQAYLPDNTEGREVLALLRKAFDARLTFTIGRSVTTGLDDQITWNDIHHKTSTHGGAAYYGYPDDNYLSKVKEELAVKGIR